MRECNVKVGDHVKRISSNWSSYACDNYPGNDNFDVVYEVLEIKLDDDYYAIRAKDIKTGIEYGLTDRNLTIIGKPVSSSYSEDFLVKNLNWDIDRKSLKSGQKVKFRDIKWYKQHRSMSGNIIVNSVGFTSFMIGCCGKEYTIEAVNDKYIFLNGLSFTCDLFMFEKIKQQTEIPLDLNVNNKHLFVPGIKVKVRSLDWYNKYKDSSGCIDKFTKQMCHLLGKTFTIDKINDNNIIILKEESYRWFPYMFEDIKETNNIKPSEKTLYHDDELLPVIDDDKEDYSVFVRKNKIKLINPKTESYE